MRKVFRTWIYHATKKPKVIKSDEFELFESQGWADSPAKFAKIVDFGVDEDNAQQVQALGEAIDGVKDAANGALNIGYNIPVKRGKPVGEPGHIAAERGDIGPLNTDKGILFSDTPE